jgi:histidinol-phosphatase (PHP family)
VAELQAAAAGAGVTLRIGVEADFFPETVRELGERLAQFPFDYVIGSVHYVDGFPIDRQASDWDALPEAERNAKWRLYWERIRQMAASGVYDFAAHLDLPKKFGHRPTAVLAREEDAALEAIAAAGMAIEINTAGWKLPAQECYPSLPLLRAARERNIPLLINADAHRAEHLTYEFARARAVAREAGYADLVRYAGRCRYPGQALGKQAE